MFAVAQWGRKSTLRGLSMYQELFLGYREDGPVRSRGDVPLATNSRLPVWDARAKVHSWCRPVLPRNCASQPRASRVWNLSILVATFVHDGCVRALIVRCRAISRQT